MMLDPLVRSMLLQLRFLVRLSIFASSSSRPRHCLYPMLGSPNILFIFDRSSVVSASTMSPPHTLPIHTLRLSMYCSRCGPDSRHLHQSSHTIRSIPMAWSPVLVLVAAPVLYCYSL